MLSIGEGGFKTLVLIISQIVLKSPTSSTRSSLSGYWGDRQSGSGNPRLAHGAVKKSSL